MAEWRSANLANIVPSAVLDVVSSVRDLLGYVTTILDVIKSILGTIKGIAGLAFDFLNVLRDQLIGIKNDFLFTGMYSCNMIDYPVRQLTRVDPTNYGPDFDFTKAAFGGHNFKTSFLSDFTASFLDMYDSNRPVFSNDCSMLLLVAGAASLDALPINPSGDIWAMFSGLGPTSSNALKRINKFRTMFMFHLIRSYADQQSPKTAQAYFKRTASAFKLYNRLSDDEAAGISSIPFDPITGQYYLLHATKKDKDGYYVLDSSLLNWTKDVEPFLTEVELTAAHSNYPDWNRLSLKDINSGLVELIDAVFDPIIDLFVVAPGGILQQISKLVDAIQKKIDYLEGIIDVMDSILERIDEILRTTGISALFVNTSGGTNDLRLKTLNATNLPFTAKGYFSGIAFLVGGTPVTIFNNTLGLIAA